MAAKAKKTATKSSRARGAPPAVARQLVTRSEFARHRGVSPQRVQEWEEKGQLVTVGEGRSLRVDLEASDARVNATRDPQQDLARGARTDRGDGDVEPGDHAELYAEFRARREKANAELAELKLAEERGRLIDRTAATSAVYDLAKRHQQGLLNLPARVSATLAARLGVDEHAVSEALEEIVREHLREQGRMTLRLKSSAQVDLDEADDEGEEVEP